MLSNEGSLARLRHCTTSKAPGLKNRKCKSMAGR